MQILSAHIVEIRSDSNSLLVYRDDITVSRAELANQDQKTKVSRTRGASSGVAFDIARICD